ncbi:MAG: hypothetical protein JWM95_1680 [Gemmatimonadetes bacterium]|nr:hypothetical protein [Gemmatimonadota bacterium]
MAALAKRGAVVAFEVEGGGVEEGNRDRTEQRSAVQIECLFYGIGSIPRWVAVAVIDHRPRWS